MASDATPEVAVELDEAAKKRGFRFALAVVFLDMLAIGIAVPVMPLLVGEFVTSKDDQAFWFGILAATFGLMQFLCMPLLGGTPRRPIAEVWIRYYPCL